MLQHLVKVTAIRFSEPSSWAGIAATLGVFGLNTSSPSVQAAIMVASGISGLVAFFLPEGK
jgi:hypothetical protein